jgi:hypothetical protein
MLLTGDRARIKVKGDVQTWNIVNDVSGKPWDRLAQRNSKTWRLWFDGQNYRVGQYKIIDRI